MPWLVASVIDPRRTMESRLGVAEQILGLPLEQVDEWFGKVMLTLVRDADSMFEPAFQSAILSWAWSVHLTIAQIEFQHGRNRARSNENMHWHTFQVL
jgi:hypothetical protein